jgi:hypothetical protein
MRIMNIKKTVIKLHKAANTTYATKIIISHYVFELLLITLSRNKSGFDEFTTTESKGNIHRFLACSPQMAAPYEVSVMKMNCCGVHRPPC